MPRLAPIRNGRQVWSLADAAHMFRLDPPEDGDATVEQCDAADEFLTLVHESAEVSEEVNAEGPVRVLSGK